MINTKKKIKAFTLAETLIALVIVGVIAAITVPGLIQKTQNKENAAKIKKAYSVLQNTIHKIALDNGYSQGDFSFLKNNNFIDKFAENVNTTKKCTNTEDCFGSSFLSADRKYRYLNNRLALALYADKAVITPDGIMYAFTFRKKGISTWGLSESDKQNVLGRIFVDVNGQKKPNTFGKDTFIFFIINKKGIIPAGTYSTSSCKRNSTGYECAAKVLREGDINY